MSKRHEQRYKAALGRISQVRVAAVTERVRKVIPRDGAADTPKFEALLRHKLGVRSNDTVPA